MTILKSLLPHLILSGLSVVPVSVFAQSNAAIEEIIITATRGDSRAASPTFVLDNEDIRERQPIAVADVFSNIPGLSIRVNSRGESVVRVRGAEERQTLVFLDGAPLATPWDGRANLALLPAGLIDRIEVTRGVAPIEYGANAVAGAIDLVTYLPDDGVRVRAEAQHGSLGLRNVNALAGLGLDNGWSFVAAGSVIRRDAERIAKKSSIIFDPSAGVERTNTDLSGNTLFAAAAYSADTVFLRASVIRADVERGIAAEGDIDPAIANPRFWRIPDWRLTQMTLNGSWSIRSNIDLRVTAWQQWFDQTIDAYSGYSYTTLEEREQGQDRTTGARLTLTLPFERSTIRVVTTAQESTHRQTDSETTSGRATDLVAGLSLRYRQQLVTMGVEADVRLADNLSSTFGFGVDRAATPLTGDKPTQASLSATGWSAALRWMPSKKWATDASLGQRSRFPSPRELYGVALGRFLLNPNLQAERSILGDLSLELSASDMLSFDVSLWANMSEDTLSQRVVRIDGVNRRQRYNTNGSFTYGVDAATTWAVTRNFRAEISTAIQGGEAERDDNGVRPRLLQRPSQQFNVALDWQATPRLDLRAELQHTGDAFDLGDSGEPVRLPPSDSVNLRAFFNIGRWWQQDILLTAAVDNLTDELLLPQLGLPAPGRSFHFGIRVN